jgi:imidazolonepropionase-like amidohydrolase
VEAGRIADLAIVDGNPLEDISATYRVFQVVANGRLYGRQELVRGQFVK